MNYLPSAIMTQNILHVASKEYGPFKPLSTARHLYLQTIVQMLMVYNPHATAKQLFYMTDLQGTQQLLENFYEILFDICNQGELV